MYACVGRNLWVVGFLQKQFGRAATLLESCLQKAPQSKDLKLVKVGLDTDGAVRQQYTIKPTGFFCSDKKQLSAANVKVGRREG